MTFNLDDAIGETRFRELITTFYDRLFDDLMVGFLFQPFEKQHLIDSQMQWLRANLGDKAGTYEGKNIREAHEKLPILVGHFDRRHTILAELLVEFAVEQTIVDAWLTLDQALRPLVVRVGESARDDILNREQDEDT